MSYVVPGRPFPLGYTEITRIGEPGYDTGISFGILRLESGESLSKSTVCETALVLLAGEISGTLGETRFKASRTSLLDEECTVLHAPRGETLRLTAATLVELALFEVENDQTFAPTVFDGRNMLEVEQRGKGLLDGTAHRVVKTVFDDRNRPQAAMMLGEVLTLPGRWSGYPPHHHLQPEIYHYRFDHPSGFGFSEVGDSIARVRHGDTLKIPPGADHAQVAAPGYAMYYLWAIRHLEGNRYRKPEYTESHRWLLDPGVRVWRPKGDTL